MEITLTLKPGVEKGLLARAQQRGLTLDAYLNELVQREAGLAVAPPVSGEDKARAFAAWARSHRTTMPLPDEAISRATLYPDRS